MVLLYLSFEWLLARWAGSALCVFWWAAFKYIEKFNFDAELISIWSSLAVSIGFLSVVHDSYDNEKVFVIVSLRKTCVSGLGFFDGVYKLILLLVTLTLLSPNVAYKKTLFSTNNW